jgi:hypothetical protein
MKLKVKSFKRLKSLIYRIEQHPSILEAIQKKIKKLAPGKSQFLIDLLDRVLRADEIYAERSLKISLSYFDDELKELILNGKGASVIEGFKAHMTELQQLPPSEEVADKLWTLEIYIAVIEGAMENLKKLNHNM